jgi:hypothetical protein
MKWWSLVAAKAALVLALHLGLMLGVNRWYPDGVLGTHLQYTFAAIGVDLVLFVVAYFLWLDQRYRCRTCLRRLRMPVATGSFGKATLFSPPHMEWICPFGHGTMREPGAPLGQPAGAEWVKHEDNFWKAFDDAWKKD